MTLLPIDANNHPIPAMRLKKSGAHSVAVSAASARNSTAFDADTKVVSVYSTVPVYIRMGDSGVTATSSDHYYPSGIYYDFAIGAQGAAQYTHMAVLRADGADGVVYFSEKE